MILVYRVVVNVMDGTIIVSKFKLQSCFAQLAGGL